MEVGVAHAAHQDRVIPACNQSASGENHPVVEVFDTEVAMQRVVDPHRQFVDAVFVDGAFGYFLKVEFFRLKLVRNL